MQRVYLSTYSMLSLFEMI